MIKELIHDPIFLAGKSEVATKERRDLDLSQWRPFDIEFKGKFRGVEIFYGPW